MTLNELKVFYEIINHQNTSLVAKQLNLSQSAISLSLKSLETKLGVKLFDRISKKLILNENGKIFKQTTYPHYEALQDSKLIFQNNDINAIFNISASRTIGDFILPKIIFDFLEQYPNIKFNKNITNSQNIINQILEGKIDFGFIETEYSNPNIIKETIISDKLIVVSADKSLTNKEYFIDELFHKKWILRENGSGTRDVFLNILGDVQNELPIFMELQDFSEIKTLLIQEPKTITTISEVVVKEEIKRRNLFEIKVKNLNFKRNFYLIYHKNKYHSKAFLKFKKFIRQRL